MSSVVGRSLVYNRSVFDGNNPAGNIDDLGAVAPDKSALLPGETATFANYSSYSRGINCVEIDIAADVGTLNQDSFQFRVGTSDDPNTWSIAPAPVQVMHVAPAEASDTGRYLIVWSDGAILNQWLQVTVKSDAEAGTGLASRDVSYFGNLVGETGDRSGSAEVTNLDALKVRLRLGGRPAGLAEPCDFNRDGRVNALDLTIARGRMSRAPLRMFTAPPAPDVLPPEVSISEPASGSVVTGPISVSAAASDDTGVIGVQFLMDGAPVGAEDTTAPYSVEWDPAATAEGVHLLTAVARDGAGNTATSPAVDVNVRHPDISAPSVSLTAPTAGAIVGANVTLTATAIDNVGVAGVQFLVDGTPVGAEDTDAPYTLDWDARTVADGTHTLTARARDAAGNAATSAGVTVTVANPDTTPPTVVLTAPVGGATVATEITISADASDNVAVAAVQFFVDGTPVGSEDNTAPYSVAWDSRTVADGTHTVTARARDAAGNTATSEGVTVTVANSDTTTPTVVLTAPAAGATVAAEVTLSADASDNVAVAAIQFFVDGAPVGSEDTTAPYSVTWDSRTSTDGTHIVTARARDAAGNATTSAARTITVANAPTGPAAIGQWSPVMNWPLVAINQVLLKDGRVLMWDGEGDGTQCIGSSSARVYDPSTGLFTPVPIPWFTQHEDDIFCSGQTLLADGRVLIVGGHDCDGPGTGIRQIALFNPATMTWTRGPNMQYPRWYPTVTTLSDGRGLILGGAQMSNTDFVTIPEIYDPVSNTVTQLDNASLSIPSYSFVYQHPDGRVIVTGSDESKMRTYVLDVAAQRWTTLTQDILDAGSGVMYRPGKFMKAGSSYLAEPADNGGAVPSLATTWVLDTTAPWPAWQQTASMANSRSHLNLTLLPDGNVLAIGGSKDIGGLTPSRAVYPAEVWSPVTQTWTTLASMQTPRMYHSTSLLLPDGRVLVAGGGRLSTATNYLNAEIYSPGYLFNGARPTITSAPTQVGFGANFFVGTPDAAGVASVALVRNGAVTHGVDMNQRYLPLTFRKVAGGLAVDAPADSKLAPPGDYMLFIVNSNGVPSVAPFVRFPAPSEDAQPPTAPTSLTAVAAAPGSISLHWTAATDNQGVANYLVYRSSTAGFLPSEQNRVGSATSTAFIDTGLAAGTYYYVVKAADAAGNVGPASNEASATAEADTSAPSVSITAPADGATVSGTITLSADASDNVDVASVRFLIDGVQVGAADTSAPYSVLWSSRDVANGSHALTAVARDASGNESAGAPVAFNVSNSAVVGLVAAWGFDEGSGAVANDATGNGHLGAIENADWSTAGRFGGALSFNGVDSWVTVDDAADLHLTNGMTLEAWVWPDDIDGFETVVLKQRPGALAYALYANNPDLNLNVPAGWVTTDDGFDLGANGASTVPLNTWTHLATTYDGQAVRLYVNGLLAQTVAVTGDLETADDVLRIGGNSVWGEFFSGFIDEVRIYNRPLTAAEIQSDSLTAINAAAASRTTPPLSLLASVPPSGTFADAAAIDDRLEHPASDLLH